MLASSRPETIREGQLYYSDTERIDGLVHDLGAERNFEEVYRRYRYYEATYDGAQRVVIFRSYVRGELERTERYRYAADGSLAERVVQRAGEPPEVSRWPSPGEAPPRADDEPSAR